MPQGSILGPLFFTFFDCRSLRWACLLDMSAVFDMVDHDLLVQEHTYIHTYIYTYIHTYIQACIDTYRMFKKKYQLLISSRHPKHLERCFSTFFNSFKIKIWKVIDKSVVTLPHLKWVIMRLQSIWLALFFSPISWLLRHLDKYFCTILKSLDGTKLRKAISFF